MIKLDCIKWVIMTSVYENTARTVKINDIWVDVITSVRRAVVEVTGDITFIIKLDNIQGSY